MVLRVVELVGCLDLEALGSWGDHVALLLLLLLLCVEGRLLLSQPALFLF